MSGASVHFQKLEAHLRRRNGGGGASSFVVLVGTKLSAPDFHLYVLLDQYDTLTQQYKLDSLWDAYPKLASFQRSMEGLVENQGYLESFLHKGLPFNNPYAQFGSDLSGKTFQRGQAAPWRQRGVVLLLDNDDATTTTTKRGGIDDISTSRL